MVLGYLSHVDITILAEHDGQPVVVFGDYNASVKKSVEVLMVLFLAVCITAVSLRLFLQGSQACLYWGKRMASPEALLAHPAGFQDAISPPLWVRCMIASSVGLLALLGYGFYAEGVAFGAGLTLAAFVALAVAGSLLLPAPDSPKFLSYILADLIRRSADFEKAGDIGRAEAAKEAHRMLFEAAN